MKNMTKLLTKQTEGILRYLRNWKKACSFVNVTTVSENIIMYKTPTDAE